MDLFRDSKTIRFFVAQAQREDVVENLRVRFGDEAAAAVQPLLEPIEDSEQLRRLLGLAARCASVEEFRAGLPAAPAKPAPKRRPRSRKG